MKIDRDIANDIIKRAIERGADLAEVYMLSSRTLTVEVKSQQIDVLESSKDFGYSLRIIRKGCLGFSYSTSLNDWKTVIDNAIGTSLFIEKDPNLDVAEPTPFPEIRIYDKAVATISENDAIHHTMNIEKAALQRDQRIKRVRKASGSFSDAESLIANSKGLEGHYSATSLRGQIMVVAENGKGAQMGWGYESSRFFNKVDFERIGIEAADRALRLLGASKALTGRGYVLLESNVASEFLNVLASSFSSENIQKGKSLLIGKKGTNVISEGINIIDNGLLYGRVGSRPFDAEGISSQENKLILEGKLLSYLYNIYTAHKDNTLSTGNAIRGGIQGVPAVGISNLYLEAVSDKSIHTYAELVDSMDRGLIVTEAMGIHTANPVTGDFSVGVTGLWVERGKIKYPVKEAAISGNMLELFGNMTGVSDKLRVYGKIGSPDILIEGVDISG